VRARELGTVVVARVLPDGSETPRETAAALLASRPARAEITRLGGGETDG
jgi:ribosomal protein L18E